MRLLESTPNPTVYPIAFDLKEKFNAVIKSMDKGGEISDELIVYMDRAVEYINEYEHGVAESEDVSPDLNIKQMSDTLYDFFLLQLFS
jgi:hypothetical protein